MIVCIREGCYNTPALLAPHDVFAPFPKNTMGTINNFGNINNINNFGGGGKEAAPLARAGGEVVGNPQQSQQFQQRRKVAKEGKEAPQEVVATNLADNTQHEQTQAVTTISEQIRYKELLQAFDEKTQRWQSVICKPEHLIDQNLDAKSNVNLYAKWKFDRKYPSATTRIFNHMERRRPEYDDLEIKAELYDDTIEYTFRVGVYGWFNQAFIDPYNNERLDSLEIKVKKDHSLSAHHTELENPFAYKVIVIGRYQPFTLDILNTEGEKYRAIAFSVNNLSGELHIRTALGRKALRYCLPNEYDREITEALSVDHAAALLFFMDTIIPPSTVNQQPDSRATSELQSPKTLPPARRTRPPGR